MPPRPFRGRSEDARPRAIGAAQAPPIDHDLEVSLTVDEILEQATEPSDGGFVEDAGERDDDRVLVPPDGHRKRGPAHDHPIV